MRARMKMVMAGLVVVAGMTGWVQGTVSARAAVGDSMATVLNTAPQGLPINADGYFTEGTNSKSTAANEASISNVTTPGVEDTQAVQISNSASLNSWGSIWSKGAYFDLDKNQYLSAWIYASKGSENDGPADGMAIVLQNGGTNAYSGTGEALGAWGMDNTQTTKDIASTIAAGAIQNSWALEFDTNVNNYDPSSGSTIIGNSSWTPGDAGEFDLGNNSTVQNGGTTAQNVAIAGQHIASGYPGDSSYYVPKTQSTGVIFGKTYYYYELKHDGLLQQGSTSFIADGAWHHVTLEYTAPTDPTATDAAGSMKYTYNDKNPDTGAATPSSARSATVPINFSEFHFSNSDHDVYWGFTGSTGASSENALVDFEQVPGQVRVNAGATLTKITDKSKDTGTTINSGDTVSGGSTVKLEYDFNWADGDKDWTGVNATLNIPDGIKLTSGTYQRDDDSAATKISDLTESSGKLKVAMGDSGMTLLSGTDATDDKQTSGKIVLYGTVDNSGTTTSSDAKVSQIIGTNALTQATTPQFNIQQSTIGVNIDSETSTLNVNKGDDATVKGTIDLADATTKASDISLAATLDGSDADIKNLTIADDGTASRAFSFTVPASELTTAGNHDLSLTASTGGTDSDPATATITVGDLTFGDVDTTMTFPTTFLTGSSQTLNRDSTAFNLDVADSRTANSPWYLYATAQPMTTDSATDTGQYTLDGALIYTDADNNTSTLSSTNPVLIDSGTASGSSDGTVTTTNAANDWQSDTGIRLRVNSGAVVGSYTGEIDWDLVNAPK